MLCVGRTYYTSCNILRHFRTAHTNYLGGSIRNHPYYPQWFYFETVAPRSFCPKEHRPQREVLLGTKGIKAVWLRLDKEVVGESSSDGEE